MSKALSQKRRSMSRRCRFSPDSIMTDKILTVGFEIPGDDAEQVWFRSGRSLLDADIVVFAPSLPHTYDESTHQGKRSLNDDASFQTKDALRHWRQEIIQAVEAGKLVVVMLDSPEVVYVDTGKRDFSGTGRNRQTTRFVEELSSYDSFPSKWDFRASSGTAMSLESKAQILSSYWEDFQEHSEYRTFIEGDVAEVLVKTKSGNRILGARIRKDRGTILAVPYIDFDRDEFYETRDENGEEEKIWTDDALILGKKFIGHLVSISKSLASENVHTPAPEWTKSDTFRLAEEVEIEKKITENLDHVRILNEERNSLIINLKSVGSLRKLLYEQGKALEKTVLESLRILGFSAENFNNGGSEFDAIFTSIEGRFVGEVEGRNNRAINIDKFSQLERNLNEDFSRDEIDDFAKGVLFGNPFRLKPLNERETPFTQKCRTAAVRLGVALVNTPDLFFPCRYIKQSGDMEFAKLCREAIFTASGEVVKFPVPPNEMDGAENSETTTETSE